MFFIFVCCGRSNHALTIDPIEQFEAIEGTLSGVRQTRTTVILSDREWGNLHSYECLFRLADTPVALRVNDPIFIENSETVRVIGIHNGNGVFDAVAYQNRTSGISGNYGQGAVEKFVALGIAVIGGITVFFVAPFTGLLLRGDVIFAEPLSLLVALAGLPLLLVGGIKFLQRRSESRKIERLLNGE